MRTLRIGTRGSELALWQAHFLQAELSKYDVNTELVIIQTKGDSIQHLSFDKIEGKGFFTKEIEEALWAGEVDIAVHSMKDMPTETSEMLKIAAVSYRENPADWLLVRKDKFTKDNLLKLPENPIIGTSSARRKAQILHFRPDAVLKDLRGNVPTRLRKLVEGGYDGILLAAAGLSRLNLDLSEVELVRLNPKEFVPAPAQGVLAFQIRREDKITEKILRKIHHPEVATCTNIERNVLRLFGGGCHAPLGVYCEQDKMGYYHVWAASANRVEEKLKHTRVSWSTNAGLAQKVIDDLLGVEKK